MPRTLSARFFALALPGWLLASTASAITCDEIVNMVRVNVPVPIVVSTIQSSGTRFTEQDLACLSSNGMAPEVVAAAQAQAAAPPPTMPTGTGQPAPATQPLMPGFDADAFGAGDGSGEPPPTGAADPAILEELIAAQRAAKNLTASKGLYDLLAANQYPEFRTKIEFYLAKSLYELEMYHSAQHYFMQVVLRGPQNPYFKYALPRLVAIADYTGNDAELLRIVHRIPPEAFPRNAQDHLYYLLGRKYFERDALSDALAQFQRVSQRSELYLRSKYYEGVIYNIQGKLRSSVAAYQEVVQSNPELRNPDARMVREIEDLKDLALMNIARVYFKIQRFDNAERFYSMVDRDSAYWADSVFERGWTNFHQLDLNETLGLVLTASSPYYRDTEFNPELTILRALTFWSLCDFDEVERILIEFERQSKPMEQELRSFLDQYRTEQGKQLADKAFDAYFADASTRTVLPESLFYRVTRNRDLRAMIRHMDMMDAELDSIGKQKAVWSDSVGNKLREVIAADRDRYKQRAGLLMLSEMAKQHAILFELMQQSDVIRFEVVDAQRKDYEFRVGNVDLDQVDERRLDFATSPEIVYWPFNGEFWRDELGYYRYTEEPQCD